MPYDAGVIATRPPIAAITDTCDAIWRIAQQSQAAVVEIQESLG
jgi:hypothetical protein